MTEEFRKEAYRRFWLIKGHLGCHNWSEEDIISMSDSYLKRLWCMYQGDDMSIWEEGFEEAYQELFK
jgi:hypothetical protein